MTRPAPALSVCVPAHNEARGIRRTLDSLLAGLGPLEGRAELLVCANACADATAEVVAAWAVERGLTGRVEAIDAGEAAAGEADVRVLVTARPGKANAWNELRRRARGDVLLFADADVAVEPAAGPRLLAALDGRPDLLAAGAVILPTPGQRGLLVRRLGVKMVEFADKPAPYINGPLYAIRRAAVERIPEEILGEDAYLSMVVGPERTVKVRHAVAYQSPPGSYGDYVRRRIRDYLSDLQLDSLYGDQYRGFRRRIHDPRPKRERDAALAPGERAFKRWSFAQTWLLKLLDRVAARRARAMFRRGDIRWYTIASTKPR